MGGKAGPVGPRRRPVQDRSRETVGFILEAAARLFEDFGYERTATNRIAERAGVSIGSVYQYFPDKRALLLALAERHLDGAKAEFVPALRALREEGLAPEAFFRGFVGAVVDFHRGEGPLHDLFFEEAPRTRRLWELVASLDEACAAEVEPYLVERALGGSDPALKASVLVGMVGTLSDKLVLNPPSGRDPESYKEEVVRACLGYLGLGLSTKETPPDQ